MCCFETVGQGLAPAVAFAMHNPQLYYKNSAQPKLCGMILIYAFVNLGECFGQTEKFLEECDKLLEETCF